MASKTTKKNVPVVSMVSDKEERAKAIKTAMAKIGREYPDGSSVHSHRFSLA